MKVPPHLHIQKYGHGEPVIFLHGTATASNTWHNQVPFLVEHHFQTVTIDLPGHGDSHHPASSESYDAAHAYELMYEGIQKLEMRRQITMVGHSLGGFFCLWFTRLNPEKVARLVLISPFYTKSQLNPLVQQIGNFATIAGRIKELAPEWLVTRLLGSGLAENPPLGIDDRRQIAANYKSASPHVYNLVQSAPDLTDRLESVDAPTLVIWGKRDRTLNPNSFEKLVDRLPRAEAFCLEGCGHQAHLSQPDIVNQRMLQFLESCTRDLTV